MIERDRTQHHEWYEDALALTLGALLVSLGVHLYATATLLTGGAAGAALLLTYAFKSWSFGLVFFLLNIPFYVLAIIRMGWHFTLKTFAAITMISILTRLIPEWIDVTTFAPAYVAIAGGALLGLGVLSLIRHRAGVGGVNILAIFLQEKMGWRAGYVQLTVDLIVLAFAFFVVPPERVVYSILGAAMMNFTIALNHKPGRYAGFS